MGKKPKRLKLNEDTTFDDISEYLTEFAKQNTPELQFNFINRVLLYLGCEEVTSTGSAVKFFHKALITDPMRKGYFQVHRKHKGGDQLIIKRTDYRKFLLPPVLRIIEYKKQLETKNP